MGLEVLRGFLVNDCFTTNAISPLLFKLLPETTWAKYQAVTLTFIYPFYLFFPSSRKLQNKLPHIKHKLKIVSQVGKYTLGSNLPPVSKREIRKKYKEGCGPSSPRLMDRQHPLVFSQPLIQIESIIWSYWRYFYQQLKTGLFLHILCGMYMWV